MAGRVEDARETQLRFLLKAACLKAVMSKYQSTLLKYLVKRPVFCPPSVNPIFHPLGN